MKVTTIQIHENVKSELDKLKKGKESYEDVIQKLIEYIERRKKEERSLMIEGYKEKAKDDLRIAKEWATTELDWEYEGY